MFLTQLETSTLTNQDVSSALLCHTFTNTTRERIVRVGVYLKDLAGNGDYSVYATKQLAGAGTAYPSVLTTQAVPSGVTAHWFVSEWLDVGPTDVLKVYVVGLGGDTTTVDIITQVKEMFVNVDASGNPTPNDSSGITTILADYARRTGDYSTLTAAGIRTAVGLATANLDTQLEAIPTADENADALLKRDWTDVVGEASRSVLNALRFIRNKWTLSGTTLSVKEEDDTTEAWTAQVTTQAGAEPITGTDPS